MSNRTRRTRQDQERVFQRSSPTEQRAANVARAMQDGTFASTRFAFNKANAGRAEMDSAGNISPLAAPKGVAPKTDMVPAGGGGYKQVEVKPPAPEQMGPPKSLMQSRAPKTRTIEGKPAGQWFQDAADRQKTPNQFAKPRQAPADYAPTAQPSPTWGKTAGQIIAEADANMAEADRNMEKAKAVFKPRQAPTTSAQPPATPVPAPKATAPTQPAPQRSAPKPSAMPAPNTANHFSGSPVGEAVSDLASDVKKGAKAYASGYKSAVTGAWNAAKKMAQPALQGIANSPNFQGSQLDRWMKSRAPKVAAQ